MTKYPGVKPKGKNKYALTVTVMDRRTGRLKWKRQSVTAKDIQEAAAIRSHLRDQMRDESAEIPRMTLHTFAESWLISKSKEVAPSTANTYAFTLGQLDWLGELYVDAITPRDVKKWRDGLTGISPVTVNGHLRRVKTLLRDAKAQLRLEHDPVERVHGVREVKSREEEDANRLTPAELGRVLTQALEQKPNWAPLFATLAFTGARFGEVTALRWKDIDFDKAEIIFRRAQSCGHIKELKVNQMRRVPLADLLADILRDHRQRLFREQNRLRLASGLVFPSINGKLLKNGGGIRKPWLHVLEAANIKIRVSIHGLRRTFNNISRQIVGKAITQALVGHVTDQMTEHYSHIERHEKQAAVDGVAQLLSTSLSTLCKPVDNPPDKE